MRSVAMRRHDGVTGALTRVGATVASIGLLRIAVHVSSASFDAGPICGAATGAALLPMLQDGLAHCWGCPVALAGLGLMLGALALALSEGRLGRGSDGIGGTPAACRG